MMLVIWGGRFFDLPVKIVDEKGGRPLDAWLVVIVKNNNPALPHQMPQVIQIQEDRVKAMVAINKGKIELSTFLEKLGQSQL
jgi:hypothetical protein